MKGYIQHPPPPRDPFAKCGGLLMSLSEAGIQEADGFAFCTVCSKKGVPVRVSEELEAQVHGTRREAGIALKRDSAALVVGALPRVQRRVLYRIAKNNAKDLDIRTSAHALLTQRGLVAVRALTDDGKRLCKEAGWI